MSSCSPKYTKSSGLITIFLFLLPLSASVLSPASQRFSSRRNKGDRMAVFNEGGLDLPSTWNARCDSVTVRPRAERSVVEQPYKYMFQKLSEKANGEQAVNILVFFPTIFLSSC